MLDVLWFLKGCGLKQMVVLNAFGVSEDVVLKFSVYSCLLVVERVDGFVSELCFSRGGGGPTGGIGEVSVLRWPFPHRPPRTPGAFGAGKAPPFPPPPPRGARADRPRARGGGPRAISSDPQSAKNALASLRITAASGTDFQWLPNLLSETN